MLVKAAPGLQVPKEDNPRRYITDSVAEEVPESAYYARRLADGDLIYEAVDTMAVMPQIKLQKVKE